MVYGMFTVLWIFCPAFPVFLGCPYDNILLKLIVVFKNQHISFISKIYYTVLTYSAVFSDFQSVYIINYTKKIIDYK